MCVRALSGHVTPIHVTSAAPEATSSCCRGCPRCAADARSLPSHGSGTRASGPTLSCSCGLCAALNPRLTFRLCQVDLDSFRPPELQVTGAQLKFCRTGELLAQVGSKPGRGGGPAPTVPGRGLSLALGTAALHATFSSDVAVKGPLAAPDSSYQPGNTAKTAFFPIEKLEKSHGGL